MLTDVPHESKSQVGRRETLPLQGKMFLVKTVTLSMCMS